MAVLNDIELVSTGYYLPGQPIPFESLENVIGELDNAPEKIKKTIKKLKSMMRDVIKTKYSYYVIDPETKKAVENNADMSSKAIKKALNKAGIEPNVIEAIYLATPVPDNLVPCTSPYVQEKLGIENCAEIQITSNCTSITKAFECAFDALRAGRYKTVAVVYSQIPSVHLIADYYNQEKITLENILLRWFLSDGAAAVILKAVDPAKDNCIKLTGVYNKSMGVNQEAGMWIFFGSANLNLPKVFQEGRHHFGQDYKTVNEKAPPLGAVGFRDLLTSLKLKASELNHLIITLPSHSIEKTAKDLFLSDLSIPREIWFSNVAEKGYVGGGSLLSSLDDLISKGMFKKGETTICYAVESSKWMVGGFSFKHV